MKTGFAVAVAATLAFGAILLPGMPASAASDRGVPLLTDDFSMKETFPERWRVGEGQALRFRHGDGALHADGKGCVVEASLLRELPESFWIESEIVYESDATKDYWAGFAIDGHLFLTLQGRSWLHPSVAAVDSGKQVAVEGYEKGRPMRIAVARQRSGETFRYSLYLDGRAAGSFVAPAPAAKAPFAFRVWNCAVAFRRFALCALKTGDASPNLVYNASCERTYDDEERLPQLINVWRHFPFGKEPIESYETRYLGMFRTDASEKHSGERSVRVDINECMFEPEIWPWGTGSVQDQPGVFSVWMKASVDGLPVKLEYGGVWNHVKVTREWTRYSVFNPSLPKLGPYSPVRVAVVNPDRSIRATLWLDDFQAEIGTEPTPFRLSDLDKDMFADRTVEDRAKGFDVPELPAGVKPTAAAAEEAPKTEVVGRLNFYMNEPEAEYRIIRPDGVFETVKLPLADQPLGTNRVTLTAKDGTTCAAELVKLPYNRFATQINRFARCIERQGKKIFPTAKMSNLTWWEPEYAAGIAELYGRIGGVNSILETVDSDGDNVLKGKAALDKVFARLPGLYRIHEFQLVGALLAGKNVETLAKARRFRAFVHEKFDTDEDVLLTGVVDEPELVVTSEDCYRLLKELRPNYPYRPMMMNSTLMGIPNNYANLETDILGLDDYLTGSFGRTVADSLVNVDICSETGKRLHRPSFACMVSGNTPYNCREPSRAEQVAQCYGAFAGGINGFFLWGDLPYSRGDWEGNKQVCREFAELTPYVLTEEPDPEVTASESRRKLRRRCCRLGAVDTLVAVNVDERPVGTVTFTLPADRKDVKKVMILFENREIVVRNGKFTDEFGALTRHVYRW